MKQYIGTKIVKAWPILRVTSQKLGTVYVDYDGVIPHTADEIESGEVSIMAGYRVKYEDGYLSWSPKDVFEAAYRETTGISFGLAIEAAKMGKKISRAGWNGKNQYVELATRIDYCNTAGDRVNVNHEAIGSKALAFVGTSGVQLGWLASQADMLADDWRIVE